MAKIKCPNGATYATGRWKGKPIIHDEDGTGCPVCSKLATNIPQKIEPATEPTKPPEEKPKPAPRPGIFKRLGFGSRTTEPEVPTAPPKNPEPEYYVDAAHVKAMANTVYGGLRYLCDRLDDWFETEKAGLIRFTKQHPALLKLSDIEIEGIEADPKSDLWGRFSTGLTRALGARTQAQAHGIINAMQFFARFGAFFAFALEHYHRAWVDGKPYRQAKTDAKKVERAEKRRGWSIFGGRKEAPALESGAGGGVPEAGSSVGAGIT